MKIRSGRFDLKQSGRGQSGPPSGGAGQVPVKGNPVCPKRNGTRTGRDPDVGSPGP